MILGYVRIHHYIHMKQLKCGQKNQTYRTVIKSFTVPAAVQYYGCFIWK